MPEETALDQLLRQQTRGRLEQEFVPPDAVTSAVTAWQQQAQPQERSLRR